MSVEMYAAGTLYYYVGMAVRNPQNRAISPLWIVALFLSFSETVLGVALVKTTGGIQVALTVFVIAFPTFVSAIFFLILWKRPQVFYTPKEFSGAGGVRAFVEGMALNQHPPQIQPISEAVLKNFESKIALLTDQVDKIHDPKQRNALILKEAKDAFKESVIQIDTRPIFGTEGRVWEESFDPSMPMSEFLDVLYFKMQPWGIPAHTYGEVWAIKIPETGATLLPAGRRWARHNGLSEDTRPIGKLGLQGGMRLQIESLNDVTLENIRREY